MKYLYLFTDKSYEGDSPAKVSNRPPTVVDLKQIDDGLLRVFVFTKSEVLEKRASGDWALLGECDYEKSDDGDYHF